MNRVAGTSAVADTGLSNALGTQTRQVVRTGNFEPAWKPSVLLVTQQRLGIAIEAQRTNHKRVFGHLHVTSPSQWQRPGCDRTGGSFSRRNDDNGCGITVAAIVDEITTKNDDSY